MELTEDIENILEDYEIGMVTNNKKRMKKAIDRIKKVLNKNEGYILEIKLNFRYHLKYGKLWREIERDF